MINKVFIATSLDGYIADKNGSIDWLHSIPNPDQNDMGYAEFMSDIDALIMGRNTFQTVCGFDIEWPYHKHVYVLSNTLTSIPKDFQEYASLVNGSLSQVLESIHSQGHQKLYIDGGSTIQSFLKEDLIDELIITTIPIVLGGGIALFGELTEPLTFKCVESKIYLDSIVQSKFVRKRNS